MSRPLRLYLAGPMSGLPENNHPAFIYAFRMLNNAGFIVISPHHLEANVDLTDLIREDLTDTQVYRRVIPGDVAAIARCDGVVLLPGWEQSPGVAFERHAADLFGIPTYAPDFTSDEFPGGLDDWIEATITLIQFQQSERAETENRCQES